MYDDGVYFNAGISEYEEDKNDFILYIIPMTARSHLISLLCRDGRDEDTNGRTVAEIGEEFMSYYVVGDNVDSSTRAWLKSATPTYFAGYCKIF